MKEDKLRRIQYISVQNTLKTDLGTFTLDPSIKLPVQLPEGKNDIDADDVTVENIVSGMLTIIAYDETHKHFSYYKSFIDALEPGLAGELNKAAIAKEQQKDYDFAEELFLAVYHLLPQSASCINLATLYSYMAIDARDRKNDEDEDKYLLLAKRTLQDGLRRFGENEHILAELSSFEAYMGNLEEAKEYLERYLMVASEGEKKQELKKVKEQIDFQLENDNEIKEAYDFIMLGMPDKALPIIDKFIEANPSVWNGYFIKGWALRVKKDFEGAKAALMECMKRGETNSEIYNELSICELELGNKELSKTYLEAAADLDGEDLNIMSNLAFLYLTDGQFDEAREALEKARYLSGDDKIVEELINQYEKLTGEKIGEVIHEDIVRDEDSEEVEEDDAYQAELSAIAEDDIPEEHECRCGHHHHHHHHGECGCGHHHHDHECGCSNHDEEECGCGHHHCH